MRHNTETSITLRQTGKPQDPRRGDRRDTASSRRIIRSLIRSAARAARGAIDRRSAARIPREAVIMRNAVASHRRHLSTTLGRTDNSECQPPRA
jgi:hypothetical protein